MAPYGNIISYAFTSAGRLPLSDVVIRIFQPSDNGAEDLLSVQMTDRNGKTTSVNVDTPPLSDSQSPGIETPFASVTMTAEIPGYEQIRVENVQIFAETQTIQNFRMIPLSTHTDNVTPEELFTIPPQNL